MRRPSTSSDTSVSSGSTTYSYTKDKETQKQPEKTKKGFRQKARDMVHDMGTPPTSRQDAKDGKRTLNYADLGIIGEPMARPGKI